GFAGSGRSGFGSGLGSGLDSGGAPTPGTVGGGPFGASFTSGTAGTPTGGRGGTSPIGAPPMAPSTPTNPIPPGITPPGSGMPIRLPGIVVGGTRSGSERISAAALLLQMNITLPTRTGFRLAISDINRTAVSSGTSSS